MASLRNKVETAFVNYLGTLGLSAPIYAGLGSDDKAAPCVIARMISAEEEPLYSGNYKATVQIMVKDVAASGSGFDTLADNVRTGIWDDVLPANLQDNTSGLTVWGCSSPHKIEYDTQEDCWVETQSVEIYCAPMTFPA